MTQLRRPLVLLPNLDGLVRLARDQPRPRQIELRREDPVLGVQTPRLRHGPRGLEAVSRSVIPKVHGAVVGRAQDDSVVVDGQGVDDGLVAGEVLDETTVGAHPFFEIVGGAREKGVFEGGLGQGSDGLFVMREGGHAFARGQVPQFDGGVVAACDNLQMMMM